MNRYVKQAIIFLALLLVVTLIRLPYDTYPESIRTTLQELAARERASLSIDDLSLSFPATLSSRGMRFAYPLTGTPLILPLVVDSLELSLQTLSLLALRYSTELNAKLYDGSIESSVSMPIFGSALNAKGEVQHLDLGKHPLAQAFGVSGLLTATFDLEARRRDPAPPTPEAGSLTVSIVDGHYNGGHRIAIIDLPEIREIGFTAKAQLEPKRVKVTRALLSSSLGKASLTASANRTDAGAITDGNAKISLDLSEVGKKRFAGFLALAAQLPLERGQTISAWDIAVEFAPHRPPTALVTAGSR